MTTAEQADERQVAITTSPAAKEWRWSLGVGVGILALIALVPFVGDQTALSLWTYIVMYIVLAQGWNFIGGFAGYAAFGNVAFFGIGAYAVAITLEHGSAFWLGLVIAGAVAALFAFLLGLPVLRLRGHYFAIATLGIAVALGELATSKNIGGTAGEISLTPPSVNYQLTNKLFFFGFWGLALATLLGTVWLTRSRMGYALAAIRENELAAEALGIPTYWYKVSAFVLSALPTALAGGVFAYWQLAFEATGEGSAFDVNISVAMILMTVLGGSGTILGPVLGAIIIEYLDQFTLVHVPKYHGPLLGLLIVLVTIFLPQGVIRLVRELLRSPEGVKLSYTTRLRQGVRRVARFIASNGV